MRNLPGLYWDSTRQRYFPEASRPKVQIPITSPSRTEAQKRNTHPTRRTYTDSPGTFIATKSMKQTFSTARREHMRHALLASQISSTSYSTNIHIPIVYSAPITALQVSEVDSRNDVFVGDRQGWCYAGGNSEGIVAEACLRSEISSIQRSNEITVYTSFGPDPQILARRHTSLESFILRPPQLQDVRTSCLHGRALTLGMAKKALHFPDIELPGAKWMLDTSSDVFSLHRSEHVIWAGTRSGAIRLFDLRTPQVQGYIVFSGRFHTSITHIQQIREHMLLISSLDGNLEIFDTRFVRRRTPVRALAGHMNTLTPNLGISVAPAQDFLYAAGEDHRVRAWSLLPGSSRYALPVPSDATADNPFSRTFTHKVCAMHAVSDVEGGPGLLWIASGGVLERFELGKRSHV